jgi:hypothetical protein
MGEAAEPERPAMPLTNKLMASRAEPASVLETMLARARGAEAREQRREAAEAMDPDERAANLVSRGVMPGMVTDLAQRLGDVLTELAAERSRSKLAAKERSGSPSVTLRGWSPPSTCPH